MNALPLPQIVAGIIGALIPILIQLVKNRVSSKLSRFLIALAVSAVIGTLGAVISGAQLSIVNIVQFTAIAFAMSQTVYNMVKSIFN